MARRKRTSEWVHIPVVNNPEKTFLVRNEKLEEKNKAGEKKNHVSPWASLFSAWVPSRINTPKKTLVRCGWNKMGTIRWSCAKNLAGSPEALPKEGE